MLKSVFYFRQLEDPVAFLNEYSSLTPIGKRIMRRRIRNHRKTNVGQPFVADLKSGLLIAESPIQIERLYDWLGGHVQ